jgi:hypothetical protein
MYVLFFFYSFYEAGRNLYHENLVAIGGESCISSRDVTVAFNFFGERTVSS